MDRDDPSDHASSRSQPPPNGHGDPQASSSASRPPQQPHPRRPPPLEASWINAEPFDEFIREIADFIITVSKGRTNVEIEAKVGVLIDTNTNNRVQFPVMSEIILSPNYTDLRFESNMSAEQHAHYNKMLNGRVETTNAPGYPYARVGYAHTKVVDSFHAPPPGSVNSVGKARVTTDQKTGKVTDCVNKERIANLNVYSPKHKVDWRVSVNAEIPIGNPNTPALYTRRKDRLTYTHQGFQFDLTQVHSSQDNKVFHELEVEFRDPDELLRLGALRERGDEAGWAYDELVRVFVNNIRILVRNAS